MADFDFGLAKLKYKHADGSGKVFSAPATPAAVVNASEVCKQGDLALDMVLAYLNAEYAGLLPDMEFTPDDSLDARANAIEWAKRWRYRAVDVDDNGEEHSEKKENPT